VVKHHPTVQGSARGSGQATASCGNAIGQDPADRRGAQPGLLCDHPVAVAIAGQLPNVDGLFGPVAPLAAEPA
jgi:hypothetical protein